MIELNLPYPPSVNRYYRHVGARTLISREGRSYRRCVVGLLARCGIRPTEGPLAVVIDLFPPDRRRRDADNTMKALLDSLEHGGAYHDDSQIVHLEIEKCEVQRGGSAVVQISQLDEFQREHERRGGTHVVVCCAGCGRDTFVPTGSIGDAFCDRCISHSSTHAFPEEMDREPLGDPEWFGGHSKHDLEFGHDDLGDE
ncbi:MAG: RusA family crossover junction endodeoxyribonuclease [Planctomycetaceae bacterium]|jgi:crossover junction endodeoxyribonuclease RusA|nr:RusA family crossover junction endodeoxyribonuclease [Planctomycetaceae bacterium]